MTLVQDDLLLWSRRADGGADHARFFDADRDDVLDREGDAILSSVGGYRLEGPSIRLFETVDRRLFHHSGLAFAAFAGGAARSRPRLLGKDQAI